MRRSRFGLEDWRADAPIKSPFATLKKELIHLRSFGARDEARREVHEYRDVFYNRKQLHSGLGYVSPGQYERHFAAKLAA